MKRKVLLFFVLTWCFMIVMHWPVHASKASFLSFSETEIPTGALIFTEVMFDPTPETGLPPYEYIELCNRSESTLDLGSLQLLIGERAMVLPDYGLPAGEYLLLVYGGTAGLYDRAEHAIELLPARSVLLNSGMTLVLSDTGGRTVDWMEYRPDMHAGEFRQLGGWSLERIDLDRACHADENWTSAGAAPGGSPGYRNLVDGSLPDTEMPELQHIGSPDSSRILLRFSESIMGGTGWMSPSHGTSEHAEVPVEGFRFSHGIEITGVSMADPPFNRELLLTLHPPMRKGKVYTLEIRGVLVDCSGNSLPVPRREKVALPVTARKGDLMINEILFDPLPLCNDFIELKHVGRFAIDLSMLRLSGRDRQTGALKNVMEIVSGSEIFFPGEFRVMTADRETAIACYTIHDPNTLIELRKMPSLPDKEGSLVLLDAYGTVIDEVHYHEDMHHPLLKEREGVSLERIGAAAWHSAAAVEGYATPGRLNSQRGHDLEGNARFRIEPDMITPDLDGVDDIMYIHYEAPSTGLRINVRILDARGRLVRSVAENQLLGVVNQLTWDGTDREGRVTGSGLYLLFVEILSGSGRIEVFREPVIVSGGH